MRDNKAEQERARKNSALSFLKVRFGTSKRPDRLIVYVKQLKRFPISGMKSYLVLHHNGDGLRDISEYVALATGRTFDRKSGGIKVHYRSHIETTISYHLDIELDAIISIELQEQGTIEPIGVILLLEDSGPLRQSV